MEYLAGVGPQRQHTRSRGSALPLAPHPDMATAPVLCGTLPGPGRASHYTISKREVSLRRGGQGKHEKRNIWGDVELPMPSNSADTECVLVCLTDSMKIQTVKGFVLDFSQNKTLIPEPIGLEARETVLTPAVGPRVCMEYDRKRECMRNGV